MGRDFSRLFPSQPGGRKGNQEEQAKSQQINGLYIGPGGRWGVWCLGKPWRANHKEWTER